MSKKDRKPLVPKLRFPEFRNAGGWGFRVLEEFVRERNSISTEIIPLFSLTIEDGITPKTERYERSFLLNKEDNAYKVVYPNDLAYNPMNLRFGAIARHTGGEKVALSKYYDIFYCDNSVSSVFCEYYFKCSSMLDFYDRIATGSLIEKRRVHFSQFLKFKIRFPSLAEQQKIAECLSSLEDLITAEAQKLEALKAHKKGLMQKLFPADGKTIPEWRFPEFRGKGEWESANLGSIFNNRQERGFPSLPLMSLTEQDGIIPQEGTNRKNNSDPDKSKYLRICVGDVAYNTMRMWQGRCAYVDVEGIVSPAYTVCKPIKKNNGLFFYYYFKTFHMIREFHANSQGLVNDTLSLKYDSFSKISIFYPSVLEQQKIADCLSSLDELITTQAQKIEALKAHKKGLMQGLFPSAEEVSI